MHADTVVAYNNVVTNCILYNNYSQASGGAIGVGEGAQGSVYNCSMYSNSSAYGGAIRYSYCAASEIYNCSFWENINYQSYGGGAVGCSATPLKIKNCLFYKNKITASDGKGGGFGYWAGAGYSCDLQNCTFVGNTATNGGGGISIWSGLGANFSARNLIIYDNYSFSDYQNIYLEDNSYTNSFTNCCIATANYVFPVAQGNITNAPLLVDTNVDNYRLSANSPCINTGMNQDWMTNAVDLAGYLRLRFGRVDIGAYEWYPRIKVNGVPYEKIRFINGTEPYWINGI